MPAKLLRDPHLRKLQQFRENFLFLVSDGAYPPHRQQRLFQWCQRAELDWDEARNFVFQDSVEFLKRIVGQIVADGRITPDEIAGLQKLRKRLGLGNAKIQPIERLYDAVEQKIQTKLLERAAYLSSPGLIDVLQAEIVTYELPLERQERLHQFLNRQHELAKLMAGKLPVIQPTVELYKDEVCHLDIPAIFELEDGVSTDKGARLVATNMRLMLLSRHGGMRIEYPCIQSIMPLADGIMILGTEHPTTHRSHVALLKGGTVYCTDPQYIATLISAIRRLATTAPPQPIRGNKRLPPLEGSTP